MRDPRVGRVAQKFNDMVANDPVKIDKFSKGKKTDPSKKN